MKKVSHSCFTPIQVAAVFHRALQVLNMFEGKSGDRIYQWALIQQLIRLLASLKTSIRTIKYKN